MAQAGSYGYIPPSRSASSGAPTYENTQPVGNAKNLHGPLIDFLEQIFKGIGNLFGIDDEGEKVAQPRQPTQSAGTPPTTPEATTPSATPAATPTPKVEEPKKKEEARKTWPYKRAVAWNAARIWARTNGCLPRGHGAS
jgi:hypothetical protein